MPHSREDCRQIMLDFTPFTRPYFTAVYRKAYRGDDIDTTRSTQLSVLKNLLHRGASTLIGEKFAFNAIKSYDDFANTIPVAAYPDIREYVERMLRGERDILWPGPCRRFAQSSGTSDGKSKYIPVTDDSLRINHYAGGATVVATYLNLYPESRIFSGKSFILGGSFANEVSHLSSDVRVGDLSANLIENINPLANLVRVPSKKIALLEDWTVKLPALVKASAHENITNISGVPSWFLTVLRQVIQSQGANTIHDVWPNLEVFFHGGIAFGPYRDQYHEITDPARMRYLETYNASEGFFAVQDLHHPGSMRLLLNAGVFYEFRDLASDQFLPAWEVEQGRTYALIISAPNGLWRYDIGDTVTVRSVEPLRISIAGRTKCFINAFGEEVMVHNTDTALAAACRVTGAAALDYTAAPVFADGKHRGRHQWLIEWATPPADIDEFARILDLELQKTNSDYQAKRAGDIFLDRLSITSIPRGTFDRWLASTGKLGGQRKVPRLANDRHIIDSILNT